MLFYEFLQSNIRNRIIVVLKNGVSISGELSNVDPYMNLSLQEVNAAGECPGLSGVHTCSIRGSSVKYVMMKKNDKLLEALNSGSRLRMLFDKCC
ncbi:putative LSM domain-containing protein [Ordospora pajunii]|uniref:putative LSM domain-containing protein n=1 Tax=Ordospora pajunii TaxID=3039483 RepID=UPI00295288E1|nr:putative LSM domain-containing protein [Ordospora pajunii]KAH9410752.1 putative LSM domain-containing protein [Ordospora pajunii]